MNPLYSKYLEKHNPFTDFDVNTIIKSDVIVVIPVYIEKGVTKTLDSLNRCTFKGKHISVLLIVNASSEEQEQVLQLQAKTFQELINYSQKTVNSFIHFYPVKAFNLPKKHFGAGLARKIGMDLAIGHFYNTNNEDGIIVSLDADTLVEDNYIAEICNWFEQFPDKVACSIYFEHPVEGDDFDQNIYTAIIQYELYLRYYVASLKYIGFPYAFHTVGSCFAVRATAYVKVGGMNKRQGGEEFYFIQKLVQLGAYGELNTTVIKPSSRISNRVPFGTGPTVKNIVENNNEYLTYSPVAFFDLKKLFDSIEDYYSISEEKYQELILELPGRVRSFLLNSGFWEEINNLSANCSSLKVFKKRFYHVFNAFKLVKYINYVHEHFISKIPVFDASVELLEKMEYSIDDLFDEKELLLKYREIQKNA